MEKTIDLSKITPRGGNCSDCEHFQSGKCSGCLENHGECVHMWENGCEIFRCCEKHGVKFCGLCEEFLCDRLCKTITWEENFVQKHRDLAEKCLK